jgi:hypothetical protein
MLLTLLSNGTPPPISTRVWIKVGGVWKETITWIKVSGTWKQSTPKIKIAGIWQ